ncbi:MAG TPA: hypothetical protein VNJ53_07290 [Gaiellaceae bacterium]|nr:hypothetical protein [Gaiellaceae bacterium]
MAEADDFVRIEVGLDGGQILSALVSAESADALDRSLKAMATGTLDLQAQDGTITLAIGRVVYAKRFAREGRVGFGA